MRAFTKLKKIHGEFHEEVADCLFELGKRYFAQRKYPSAIQSFNQLKEICKKLYGEAHPAYIDATEWLEAARMA